MNGKSGAYAKTLFGFWLYILTDFMMFATIFAAYAVLHRPGYLQEVINLPFTLFQTLLLLTSSFTVGLAAAYLHRRQKERALSLFAATFLLGLLFLGMEFADFSRMMGAGDDWQKNASFSIFYTLVGTHTLHIIIALLWFPVTLIPVFKKGITETALRRAACLKMFWQFLNILWIFIFTLVYLTEAAP